MRNVRIPNNGSLVTKQLRYGLSKFKLLTTEPSYLVLVHFSWNQRKIRVESLVMDKRELETTFAHILAAAVYIVRCGFEG